jgi:hypothetical protein
MIKHFINYVFSSITHDCLPTLGKVSDPTLEEIRRFGREEVNEPILELSAVAEGNSGQIVGESSEEVIIRWGKVRRVGRMWNNPPVEFLNGRFRHVCSVCVWSGAVMLKNHSVSSARAYLLDCFLQMANLLTIAFSSDGQVPLKQFIMNNPLHMPQDAQHGRPERGVTLMSKLPGLKRAKHFWAVISAIVFSVDGTNVSGGLCSFGASVELVKKKVSEMFIFLNLTLHSFGPENFVPLFEIGKFLKRLIEENESYKMVGYK